MFQVNYKILDDERKRIKELRDISEFEKGINTIVGQFQLVLNETVEGFIDNEIPYDGDFLITWFQLLNDTLVYLKKYGFAAINKPDSDNIWIEFKLYDNIIKIKQVRAEKQALIKDFIEKTSRTYSKVFWNESVSKNEFNNAISITTEMFLKDILSLNEKMSESHEFKKLLQKYDEGRKVVL